jgi:hypothetical protein
MTARKGITMTLVASKQITEYVKGYQKLVLPCSEHGTGLGFASEEMPPHLPTMSGISGEGLP